MTVAGASLSVVDGGLASTVLFDRPPAVTGCSSGGTADVVYKIYSPEQAVARFGYGKLTELIALYLFLAGGPVIACKAATVGAGAFTGLSAGLAPVSGVGAAPMTCTPSGTPRDDYSIWILVTRAGATLEAVTAAVRVSYDGGETYGTEIAVPASGALVLGTTGVTVTFSDALDTLQLYVDQVYKFGCTAPTWDSTSLRAALDALAAETAANDHEFVHVAEPITGANVAATLGGSVTAMQALGIYRWGLGNATLQGVAETTADWKTTIEGASPGWAGYDHTALAIAAGHDLVATRVTAPGALLRRPIAWLLGPRLALIATEKEGDREGLAEHPGRVQSGALAGTSAPSADVRTNTDLDTNHFMGVQTLVGRPGYIATDRTRAPSGSDYASIMNVRVIVEGSRRGFYALQEFINSNQRTIEGGFIDPRDATAADAYLTAELERYLVATGYASSASAAVDRSADIASTHAINAALRVRPLGYLTNITATIGLTLS